MSFFHKLYKAAGLFFSLYAATCSLNAQEQKQAQIATKIDNTFSQCPAPALPKLSYNSALTPESMTISSQQTFLEKNKIARFTGAVTLASSDKQITAQTLILDRENSSLKATGNIALQTNSVLVSAESLNSDKSDKSTSLYKTSYQLANNPSHGAAEHLIINNKGELVLVDANFTTCYGETPDWQLKASEINISTVKNMGEAYNARLHLFDIPVLYIPYINFPVTNQRKSGFLYPSISSSSKLGATLATPFYWNIAENFDATITPRYMSKRGTQLLTEFRYLSDQQSGIIDVEYLSSDSDYINNDARYLTRFQHTGSFAQNYRAYIDTTYISDDSYLTDIGTNHYNSNDAYIYQIGEIAYFSDSWDITAKLQDFEILGDHLASYKTLPQIEVNKYLPFDFLNGRFELYSELSHFESNDLEKPTAQRYHVEAGVVLPYSSPAWFLNSEFKLLQTYYKQNNLSDNSTLAHNVSRTLPKVRIHGGVNFDRAFNESGYTQTLEPQLQYLYISDEDQSEIGIYDSAPLQDDYAGLFRDKRYSGLDRIAEANQYSWGVTSRILSPSNDELFRFSLGRIVYLNNKTKNSEINPLITSSKSSLAAETFFKIDQQWQVSGNIQYDTDTNTTNKSQFSLDYRYNNLIDTQLNHRYIKNVSGVTLEQLSLLSNIKLNENWHFVGRVSQDLKHKRSIESYAGFQYESCCWAVRFAYHRHIDSFVDDIDINTNKLGEFNSGFVIQFVIKGLNGQNTALDSSEMLNSSIFGYKRPYFLNN